MNIIRISTLLDKTLIEENWLNFSGLDSNTDEIIGKNFEERAFDGSSVFQILELSGSFVMGVASGMLANWLGDLLKKKQVGKIRIGRKTFQIPDDDEVRKVEIINEIKSEIAELKQLLKKE